MAENAEKDNQFIDDLKDIAKNRLSNPVFFSYLFSWIIYNWSFISFMVFSNKTIEKKLSVYGDFINVWGWIYPIVGVIIYLIALNYIDIVFFWISKHGYQKKVNSLKERSTIKIRSEVEIAKKKIELQNEQIEAGKVDVIVSERDRLQDQLFDVREDVLKKDSEINDLKKQLQRNSIDRITDSFNSGSTSKKERSTIDEYSVTVILNQLGLVKDFVDVATNNYDKNDELDFKNVKTFILLGLVHEDDERTRFSDAIYLTDLGKKTLRYLEEEYPFNFK